MDRISFTEQRLLQCLEEIGSLPLPMSAEDWERLEQLEITVRLADSRCRASDRAFTSSTQ